MNITEYTEFLVKSISKDPEMIKVTSHQEEDNLMIEILVPENEMGAIIGVSGRNATALRTMVLAYAYLHKVGHIRINIDSF